MEPICHATLQSHSKFGCVLVLTHRVAAGEDIICEPPFIVLDKQGARGAADFRRAYSKLTADQRSFVASLRPDPSLTDHPVRAELERDVDHFRRVLMAYSHSYGAGTTNQEALFKNISMAPHSCNCNAAYTSAAAAGLSRLYAVRDLDVGDLVSIDYCGCGCGQYYTPSAPFWKRQQVLRSEFAFVCKCARCESDLCRGVCRHPSALSASLCEGQKQLKRALDDNTVSLHVFKDIAAKHLFDCECASENDDGPFHLMNALTTVYRFYINLFRDDTQYGDEFLVPALEALAKRYENMPVHDTLLQDSGIDLIFLHGSMLLKALEPTNTNVVLRHLWRDLGGLVRDRWGREDPEYHDHCRTFCDTPSHRPSKADAVMSLRSIQSCSLCYNPFIIVQRCGENICPMCSSGKQRWRWRGRTRAYHTGAIEGAICCAVFAVPIAAIMYRWCVAGPMPVSLEHFGHELADD